MLGECALCSFLLKGRRNTYAWQISPKMYFSKTPDCLASSAAAGKFQREIGKGVGRKGERERFCLVDEKDGHRQIGWNEGHFVC